MSSHWMAVQSCPSGGTFNAVPPQNKIFAVPNPLTNWQTHMQPINPAAPTTTKSPNQPPNITSAPPPINRGFPSEQPSYPQYPGQYQPQAMYQPPYVQPSQMPPQTIQTQGNYVEFSYVQGLIEQYLQLYYTDEEIIAELEKKNISAETTTFLLKKLKEQNPQFFKAYEIRLTIKSCARASDPQTRSTASTS